MDNKEMYEKSIADSQLKQQLMALGISKCIEESQKNNTKLDFEHIQKCFKVLEAEKNTCDFYIKMLNDIVSGEFQKREEAKAKLGIK